MEDIEYINMSKELNEKYKDFKTLGIPFYIKNRDNIDILNIYYKSKKKNRGLIILLHGGGHAMGHAYDDEEMAITLNRRYDLNVLSINYRLAPLNPFPDAICDVYDSYISILKNKNFVFDRTNINLFGASAGANLLTSLVVLLALKGNKYQPKTMVSLYPYYDLGIDPKDRPQIEGSIDINILEDLRRMYTGSINYRNPMVSPVNLYKDILLKFPSIFLVSAKYDSLNVDCYKFIELLKESKIKHKHYEIADTHGFFENSFKETKTANNIKSRERVLTFVDRFYQINGVTKSEL